MSLVLWFENINLAILYRGAAIECGQSIESLLFKGLRGTKIERLVGFDIVISHQLLLLKAYESVCLLSDDQTLIVGYRVPPLIIIILKSCTLQGYDDHYYNTKLAH